MLCVGCGQELDEGTKFCTKCGYSLINPAPGYFIIKITGILFVSFGLFRFISTIISIASKLVPISGLNIALSLISAILCCVLGVSGILYCKNLDKAKLLQYFVFGYVGFYIVTFVINTIESAHILAASGLPIATGLVAGVVGGLIYLIVPICFFIGVQKNLKAK